MFRCCLNTRTRAMTGVMVMLCLLLSTRAVAQAVITGIVTDGRHGLPGVTVLLLDDDSSVTQGIITDSTGQYNFTRVERGDYRLAASLLGYNTFHSHLLTVDRARTAVPDIVLSESAVVLDAVEVSGGKLLFEQKMDRLVINVAGSITAAGGTVLEMLQKSPGVVVNRESSSIAINGKAGVRVMINEKMVQLPLDALVQMLQGMSAAQVESIELITTPPARYDAEGNGGIIHIKTKQATGMGTSASIGMTVGARWAEAVGGNISLHHRRKRFACYVDYAVMRDHNLHTLNMNHRVQVEDFLRTVDVYSHRENTTTQHNVDAGVEFALNDRSTLTLQLTGYKRNWNLDADTRETNTMAPDSSATTSMPIREANIWQSMTASMGWQTKIDDKRTVSAGVDYLYYHNDNPSRYVQSVLDENDPRDNVSMIDLQKKTPIRMLVTHADYRHEVSARWGWEAGIKSVVSRLENDVLTRRYINGDWTTDPEFTTFSTLEETTAAAYLSTQWQPAGLWQVTGGVRYEYTRARINLSAPADIVDRRYGYFFPTLVIKRTLDRDRDIQLSYAKRISRPTYSDMAPFVFFWGSNTFSAGNTSLYPAIGHAVTGTFRVRQNVFSLQLSHVDNEIAFLQPEADATSGALIFRSQNLRYMKTLHLSHAFSFTLLPAWEVSGQTALQYQDARTAHLPYVVDIDQFGCNLNLTNQFTLPGNITIEVSGAFQSTLLKGISRYLSYGSLNMGIQKKFGHAGALRLAVDDVFRTSAWRIQSHSPENNIHSTFRYDWYNRFIRLSYTVNLGNGSLRSLKIKSGAADEKERVGN